MFSYRHAFHAGNHADLLKHAVLIAMLKHLTEKDTALMVLDTHAGAGLYRLDGDYAEKSGEAKDGFLKLAAWQKSPATRAEEALTAIKSIENGQPLQATKPKSGGSSAEISDLSPVLRDYLDLIASFNASGSGAGSHKVYPGSPFIIQSFLKGRDKLKAFELHPTDFKTLTANIAQLDAGRQVAVLREDGFGGVKRFLPPPSKRALLLCDPSYEIKADYGRVAEMVADSLKRFVTGAYAVWYPIIPRPEAHDLPRKLKTLANRVGRPWLNAALTVKSSKLTRNAAGDVERPGLPASGMFVINPPFTLKAALQAALPQMVNILAQDQNAGFLLESGG